MDGPWCKKKQWGFSAMKSFPEQKKKPYLMSFFYIAPKIFKLFGFHYEFIFFHKQGLRAFHFGCRKRLKLFLITAIFRSNFRVFDVHFPQIFFQSFDICFDFRQALLSLSHFSPSASLFGQVLGQWIDVFRKLKEKSTFKINLMAWEKVQRKSIH